MASETYAARLYEEQIEHVEGLVDRHGMKKSEAVRRLIQDGIEKRQEDEQAGTSPRSALIERLGWAFLALALAGLALELPTAAGASAIVAAALFVGGAAVRWRGETA